MKIPPLERDQAPEAARPIYDTLQQTVGRVMNFWKVLAHRPDVLRTFMDFDSAVWAPGALSPKIKELVYLRASIMNGCHYSILAHIRASKGQGTTDEQVRALQNDNGERSVFTIEEHAAIGFAEKLTAWPGSVKQKEIDELANYFNEKQIIELVLIIGMVNLTNRFNEGLQTQLDPY